MKPWMSILAILFILASGSMLAACEPPEDIDQQELDDAMQDDGQDGGNDDW